MTGFRFGADLSWGGGHGLSEAACSPCRDVQSLKVTAIIGTQCFKVPTAQALHVLGSLCVRHRPASMLHGVSVGGTASCFHSTSERKGFFFFFFFFFFFKQHQIRLHVEGTRRATGVHLSYLQRWCAWYSRPPPPEFPAVVCGSPGCQPP